MSVRLVHRGRDYVRVTSTDAEGDRAFVLVPGLGVSSDYFERLVPRLARLGPVHAVDLPGFAGVPHPAHALTIAEYATLVIAVIDDLGLVDPVVVGHSMGSQVATEVAVAHPALSTLVLIAPVVDARTRRPSLQAIDFLRAAVRDPARVKVLAVSAYLLCGWRWFLRVLPQMLHYPLPQRLALVQASTLVLRGEHDRVCPRTWVRRLLEDLPRGSAWEIPDASHTVMHSHPGAVAQLCTGHAFHPDSPLDDAELRRLQQAGDEADRRLGEHRPRPPLRRRWAAVTARMVEWRGLVGGDETAVAEGKRRRAEIYYQDRADQRRAGS